MTADPEAPIVIWPLASATTPTAGKRTAKAKTNTAELLRQLDALRKQVELLSK